MEDGDYTFELEMNEADMYNPTFQKDTEAARETKLASNLFQVMRIVSDKLDLSFVEKVQIPEDKILQLCNGIVANSAKKQRQNQKQCYDIRIDFNSLNRVSLPTIGLYGDKGTMGGILKKLGVVDDSIHKQMEKETFESGLYLGLLKQVIVVFYWHEGAHLTDASRKNVSCNFIRYVVDLCDDVYVCVEEQNLREALAAKSRAADSKTQSRNRRFQLSQFQTSEDNVEVSSLFEVNIERHISNPPPEGLAIRNHTLFFAEGYYRSAFLTANYIPSRKVLTPETKIVKVKDLGFELQQMSKEYDLDFTSLSNEDFARLLKHSALPESKNNKLTELERQVMEICVHPLPEYCSFIRHLSGSEESSEEIRKHVAEYQEIPLRISPFEYLERLLVSIWGGNSGKQKLLFSGFWIKFHPTTRTGVKEFCIEKSRMSMHPILFEDEIKLRCIDAEGGKISSFSMINKDGSEGGKGYKKGASILPTIVNTANTGWSAIGKGLSAISKGFPGMNKDGDVKKRPVMSGEQLILQYGRGYKEEGTVEVIRASEDAVREWVRDLVPETLLNVQQNIVFLCFLMSNGILEQLRGFCGSIKFLEHLKSHGDDVIEKRLLFGLLNSNDHLDDNIISDMKNFLTGGKVDIILQLIESGKNNLSPKLEESCQQWKNNFSGFKIDETLSSAVFAINTWRDLCWSIYTGGKKEYEQSVLNLIMMNMKPVHELPQFNKEQESFFTEANKSPSQRKVLKSCRIESSHSGKEAHLVFSSEEVTKPSIKWMIVELLPNQKDIDEFNSNPKHCIIPSCSEAIELACCDPELEDLTKIAFLRSGELLVFLHDKEHKAMNLYLSPQLGSSFRANHPLRTFHRGFDLIAFEESTRFLALYGKEQSKVAIYKFDGSFRKIDSTGIEIAVDSFSGIKHIKWMQCIPGKPELLLVDDTNRVWVLELHSSPLMKPKDIILSSNFLNACISGDGYFLFVFQRSVKFSDEKEEWSSSSTQETAPVSKAASDFELKVYMLRNRKTVLKTMDVNIENVSRDNFQVKLVCYGRQIHLLVYCNAVPGLVYSSILNIVSATQVSSFQELAIHKSNSEIGGGYAMEEASQNTCATLDYIYHIFDKFAVTPALFEGSTRDVNFHVMVKSIYTPGEDVGQSKCEEYLKLLIKRLEDEKGKVFSSFRIQFQVHTSESWHSIGVVFGPSQPKKPFGNWIRQLISLVPIQITRAENNGLQPLLDGLQMPPHLTYTDSVSLANLLRFGLYDAVLSQWDRKIMVVSSMGKQSSGKSYLLNHVSGSLLDVAGGRCTDGVWMTVRMDSECLYVLMDFEGLGSFERTEQEDMLLSVLNAALSSLTIFNKKDFHLDKETQSIFQRFQSGVSLVTEDEKLFKGLFYIAIKDVDVSDVDELINEFHTKLYQICSSHEFFLTKMYGGQLEYNAMPYFTQRGYQKSLSSIAELIKGLKHSYGSGRGFLSDLKLVIAQIAAKDWTPVDSKRVAMRVDLLHRHLYSAVMAGRLSMPVAGKMLMDFDAEEEVSDPPIELGDRIIELQDTGLVLAALEESMSIDEILCDLRSKLESNMEGRGKNGDIWHSKFQDFLGALADRRFNRVKKWLHCNTAEFSVSDEVQMLEQKADLALAELKQGLSVCGSKCSECFWRCAQKRDHSTVHSCMGNHVCVEKCTYCSDLHQGTEVEECQNWAGHEGNHDCKRKNHTCVEKCALFDKSSNCSESCCLRVRHEGPHKCNSSQHRCGKNCSLPNCNYTCVQQIDLGNHEKHVRDEKHACHERYCPHKCIMEGCPRSCGSKDHFHESKSDEHLCGNAHACPKKCEADGICEILTQLKKNKRSFPGKRGVFEYEHDSEQNGLRKDCCIIIPPFKRSHDGLHIHTQKQDVVHYCEVTCQACGYFCHRPFNHSGLHHTVHGNMRNTSFASAQEEFDIVDRKYVWGESGVAEMCNMHCKRQGRGHIHLIYCPMNDRCTSHIYDGSRHETRKYGPDVEVPKDELTHETYWNHMRFEDPCTEKGDQKEFALCNYFCKEDHNEIDGSSRSYCTEKLWHDPVEKGTSATSYADGHVFACRHPKPMPHHVVFVIDRSGSMAKTHIKPTMKKFAAAHNDRLGCVYEAIHNFIAIRRRTSSDDSLSVVLFAKTAILALEMQEMKEYMVDNLLQYRTEKGTCFLSALEKAGEIVTYNSSPNQKPIIIFFSDGDNDDKDAPLDYVRSLKKREPDMNLHTIFFGKESKERAVAILKGMADIGEGQFHHTIDGVQLQQSFETIATSLNRSSLITKV